MNKVWIVSFDDSLDHSDLIKLEWPCNYITQDETVALRYKLEGAGVRAYTFYIASTNKLRHQDSFCLSTGLNDRITYAAHEYRTTNYDLVKELSKCNSISIRNDIFSFIADET